jgi:hypothetical protein
MVGTPERVGQHRCREHRDARKLLMHARGGRFRQRGKMQRERSIDISGGRRPVGRRIDVVGHKASLLNG